jgi:hypothetical protein
MKGFIFGGGEVYHISNFSSFSYSGAVAENVLSFNYT